MYNVLHSEMQENITKIHVQFHNIWPNIFNCHVMSNHSLAITVTASTVYCATAKMTNINAQTWYVASFHWLSTVTQQRDPTMSYYLLFYHIWDQIHGCKSHAQVHYQTDLQQNQQTDWLQTVKFKFTTRRWESTIVVHLYTVNLVPAHVWEMLLS